MIAKAPDAWAGYKNVPWGTSISEAQKLLPPKKGGRSCPAAGDSMFLVDEDITEAIIAKGTISAFKWGYYDNRNFPRQHIANFRNEKLGGGCGLFFKGKLVAFNITFYATKNTEILQDLKDKYGDFKVYESGGFFASRRVSIGETKDDLIFFHAGRLKKGRSDIPSVFYLPKTPIKEVDDSLAQASATQAATEKQVAKKKAKDRRNDL
jgi:hypothetical protein